MGDGKQLKETLQKHGVNVRQLSKMTGIKATTLYSIVQKDSFIRFDYGLKIAHVLNEDVNVICTSKPLDGKMAEEDVYKMLGDVPEAMDKNRMKEYLLKKAFPLLKLFGSKNMTVVDEFLRAYYQLPDKDRKEMIEHMDIIVKYHSVPERTEEVKHLPEW
ncbi:MAG: helix-turn-helix transcriptional regulator [Butyrivibrio sp.]|uniref:helix-turn-helix domain-containing protein n=1 Tax=Butyrivibrio sp. TaxID=28121 RepID=UPI001B2BCBF1|nr:helix-turn-helix transcriptional regulator [Butyrivibrio sp.]MBO6241434.1 helix-turn-helix transcriptional regulator [Butyrivibrio sp.]